MSSGRRWTLAQAAAVAAAVAAAAGCQSRTVRVEGQVVWDDGRPAGDLGDYLVESHVPGSVSSSRAQVGPDGRFEMATFEPGDGAEPGAHRVCIIALSKGDFEPPPKVKLPSRYANPDTSGLSFTAERGKVNTVTLTVSRK